MGKEKNRNGVQNRRSLAELNLIDDFLFREAVSDGEAGEEVCRILLRTILNRPVGRLRVTAQRVIGGMDTDLRGIRLDAYVEPESKGRKEKAGAEKKNPMPEAEARPDEERKAEPKQDGKAGSEAEPGVDMEVEAESELYDIEPDTTYERETLPWRTRLYQALIDAKQLKSGWDYRDLKNVYVILILPYDPFGKNRMVYTVRNRCVEDAEVPYEDGACKLYLYTRGTEGNPSQELQDMLRYIETSIAENVTNEDIRKLHARVSAIKQNQEVGVAYMKSWERENWIRREGRAEGRAEGREEGREEGHEEERRRMNTLILKLTEAGRTDDLIRAASDQIYQEKLIREYGLV